VRQGAASVHRIGRRGFRSDFDVGWIRQYNRGLAFCAMARTISSVKAPGGMECLRGGDFGVADSWFQPRDGAGAACGIWQNGELASGDVRGYGLGVTGCHSALIAFDEQAGVNA